MEGADNNQHIQEVYEVLEDGEIVYEEAISEESFDYSEMPYLQQQQPQPSESGGGGAPQRTEIITLDSDEVMEYTEYAYEVQSGATYNQIIEGHPIIIDAAGNIVEGVSSVISEQQPIQRTTIPSFSRIRSLPGEKADKKVRFISPVKDSSDLGGSRLPKFAPQEPPLIHLLMPIEKTSDYDLSSTDSTRNTDSPKPPQAFIRTPKPTVINATNLPPLNTTYWGNRKINKRSLRRLMPGKRKPCNCTRSQCLKLYCECFANGEFCYDCNCRDCHNNLEYNHDRSRAIKTSLERNPNAFKPKIGVAQKGKNADIERLHQKGCHCKKSNCLKNYCECYEAKVACTSRCKCRCCRNTEADRQVRFSDRFTVVNEFDRRSPCSEDDDTNGEPHLPKNLRTQVWYYLTDDVVEATTMCLLATVHESENNKDSNVNIVKALCNEFGSCMNQIFDATRLAQLSNDQATAEYLASLDAQDAEMYKGEELILPHVLPHSESAEVKKMSAKSESQTRTVTQS